MQCIAFVQSYLISLQFCNCNAITIFCCNLFNKNCNSAIFVKWRSGTASGGDHYGVYGIYFNKKLVYIGKTNRNFIYALGHQGTSENLNLIFWDGSVWRQLGIVNAAGSDRPVYSFGKIEVEKEEDWLVEIRIKEEKKPKSKVKSDEPLENVKTIKVEEITLSAGIQSQLNRDWLNQS